MKFIKTTSLLTTCNEDLLPSQKKIKGQQETMPPASQTSWTQK